MLGLFWNGLRILSFKLFIVKCYASPAALSPFIMICYGLQIILSVESVMIPNYFFSHPCLLGPSDLQSASDSMKKDAI